MEALIGAAYLEGGLAHVERLVDHLWEGRWPEDPVDERVSNWIGKLQEAVQHKLRSPELPSYLEERDPISPDHEPRFVSTVMLPWGKAYTGEWQPSVKHAQQDAARIAWNAEFGDI